MTTDERFERIEHFTAGMAEERRKDREEYKALWRDTERQMYEFGVGLVELRRQVSELAVETRLRFQEQADDWRAADRALREQLAGTDTRIAALGEHLPPRSSNQIRFEGQSGARI
jgi:hypothetical protein